MLKENPTPLGGISSATQYGEIRQCRSAPSEDRKLGAPSSFKESSQMEAAITSWKFEETKDTPFGRITDVAASKYLDLNYEASDYYDYFPCFVGVKTIARYMSLYEHYKATLGLAGHIAEVGVYRGAVSMFFAKLSLLHEPQTTTQCHGFDWFRDEEQVSEDERGAGYQYFEPYERIRQLIDVQGLQRWVLLHRINVLTELKTFFETNSHLQFKLVFLDCGDYDLVARCIQEFWPRLLPGGRMVFDQFNHEVAPGESKAVREFLPEDAVIRADPHGWMPSAYVVKGETVSGQARSEDGWRSGR